MLTAQANIDLEMARGPITWSRSSRGHFRELLLLPYSQLIPQPNPNRPIDGFLLIFYDEFI